MNRISFISASCFLVVMAFGDASAMYRCKDVRFYRWYSPMDTYFRARWSSREGESLVQHACRAPSILQWVRGRQVRGAVDLPPNVAIASFASNGLYWGHAAIYKYQTPLGIVVIDQTNYKPASERLITFSGRGPYDDANSFFVIEHWN